MSPEIEHKTEKICLEMRQAWMAVLSNADIDDIETRWKFIGFEEPYEFLKKPEPGMVMVRGRVDGTGQPFNIGEMTVTRCAVRLENGLTGCGYVMGMNERHAELAALCDALLQSDEWGSSVIRQVIRPVEKTLREKNEAESLATASTKVEFFTMVRGE